MRTRTPVACIDGNEAAARVAHALSEVIAIYPITPASSMGELADTWSAAGRRNLWGAVPDVVEMQSEAGAAGVLHGAAMKGALATTFTSSQGLLLMLPNMFKLAGELLPSVIHVAARTVATHALSIFGDHSDVMAARTTGFAMLASTSVQEAHDLALVAHAASLESSVPFLHFFDGFRTSHEMARIELLDEDDLRAVVDDAAVARHRARGLSPDHPVIRGTAQNPDVFFQSREAAGPVYAAVPEIVERVMARVAERTGRRYRLVEYAGAPDADRVLVLMGSAAGAAAETVEELARRGERVGAVVVRLFRPFPVEAFLDALPSTARTVAVLDRTKEPGAIGDPLYLDVVAAMQGRQARVVGARYGLASKELTPAMLKGLLDELSLPAPRRQVTLGIVDDVGSTSVAPDDGFVVEGGDLRAVFYGLGSDGTVGAAKQTVKILAEGCGLHAQGYFVYDSKKAGTLTVAHIRSGTEPIRSTYLVQQADFVACHQFAFLDRVDMLSVARPGATFLLNSPFGPDEVWGRLPREVQEQLVAKGIDFWVVDAEAIAQAEGLGRRVNTIMQAAFFGLAGVLPEAEAVAQLLAAVERAYAKRGPEVVEQNRRVVQRAIHAARSVPVPASVDSATRRRVPVPADAAAPEVVRRVIGPLLAGDGDRLPVSAMPVDGAYPTGTARWEKRSLAASLPEWDPSICTDCGKCAIACPHAAIRMKVFTADAVEHAPEAFVTKDFRSHDLPGHLLSIQVAPDDCTGCGVCVEVCPGTDKLDRSRRSLAMAPADGRRPRERVNWDFFLGIPELDVGALAPDSVKGSQVRTPLFEFSGACGGCGETPYLKLLTQLFGDRAIVANATGCSSIYGGNLPTTPWSCNAAGQGPAWANSLFEDNAEFGLGLRVAADHHHAAAAALLQELAPLVGEGLAAAILEADQSDEAGVRDQRRRVAALQAALASLPDSPGVQQLQSLADELVKRSVWIVGGDGWAYDIGFGGVDHVLSGDRDVNLLVLDTEVYSNTGGQASKATPRGAVARFASAGKRTAKKDLGLMAMSYGSAYVAQVSLGGSDMQTVKAFCEADAWPGPSLIVAYASCVPAHGFEESQSMAHQRDAVKSGHWPLYRYTPGSADGGREASFLLDSRAPTVALRDFALSEERFASLARRDPEAAMRLLAACQADDDTRRRRYEQFVTPRR